MPALVQNPAPGMEQQAALAPWLRQATGAVSPVQHANPPAAPWYEDAMKARQTSQAGMVRQWKVEQERKALEAAAAAARAQAEYDSQDNRSSWVRFRDDDAPADLREYGPFLSTSIPRRALDNFK